MNRIKQLQYLNRLLLAEMPEYKPQAQRFSQDADSQRRLSAV